MAVLLKGASQVANLAGDLLNLDDDEFGRLQRRKADDDVDDAAG